jgi:RNA polymerase sigma factor (sigma-70 family)
MTRKPALRPSPEPRLFASDDEETKQARKRLASGHPSEIERAWTYLYGRYWGLVYSYLLTTLADADLACEFAQETFLRAMGGYKPHYEFTSYLGVIARNLCFDHFRRSGVVVTAADEDLERMAAETEEIQEAVDEETGDTPRRLAAVLAQLDEASQELLRLRCVEHWSLGELAEYHGLSRTAILKRERKALQRVQELLEKFDRQGALTNDPR